MIFSIWIKPIWPTALSFHHKQRIVCRNTIWKWLSKIKAVVTIKTRCKVDYKWALISSNTERKGPVPLGFGKKLRPVIGQGVSAGKKRLGKHS